MVVDCGSGGRWKAEECSGGGARLTGTYNSVEQSLEKPVSQHHL